MKKVIFGVFTLLMLALSVPANAQMRWGVTASANFTDLKWSQSSLRTTKFNSEVSAGYSAGVIGEYSIPGIGFGIDLGLQYIQRGATMNLGDFKVWNSDGFGNERVYLHYLEIPIHLRFKYSNLNGFERKLAPLVFVGPSLSVLLTSNKIAAFETRPVDFGMEVGGGAEIFRNTQLTLRYNWGLTGALRTVKLDNFKANNRTWKVSLSYFF